MVDKTMLEQRFDFMEKEIIPRMATAIDKMTDSLQRLTAIDERQGEFKEAVQRAFAEIRERKDETRGLSERLREEHGKYDERLREVELVLPILVLIKNWVITGVIGMVGLVLTAVVVVIFKLPHL